MSYVHIKIPSTFHIMLSLINVYPFCFFGDFTDDNNNQLGCVSPFIIHNSQLTTLIVYNMQFL